MYPNDTQFKFIVTNILNRIDLEDKEEKVQRQVFLEEMKQITGDKGFILVTNKKNGK